MEVIIFLIVLCFLFSSQKKKRQKVGIKETQVQNRPVTDYRPQTQSRPVNSTQSSMQRSNIQGRQVAVRTAGGAAGSMTPGNGSTVSRKEADRQPAGKVYNGDVGRKSKTGCDGASGREKKTACRGTPHSWAAALCGTLSAGRYDTAGQTTGLLRLLQCRKSDPGA